MHNEKEQLEMRYSNIRADMKALFTEVEAFAKRENPLQVGDIIKSVGLKYKGRKLRVTSIQVTISRIDWAQKLTYSTDTLAVLLDGAGKPESTKWVRLNEREHGDKYYQLIKKAE